MKKDFDALLNSANDYAKKLNHKKAIADLTAALKIKPDDYKALFLRGQLFQFPCNNDKKAIEDFTAALKVKPDSDRALFFRGQSYWHSGKLDLAIADYTASLNIKPNQITALQNRGSIYIEKGELDLAIKDYTTVLNIDPNFTMTLESRGQAYEKKGELILALSDYNALLKLDPSYEWLLKKIDILTAEINNRNQVIAASNSKEKTSSSETVTDTKEDLAEKKNEGKEILGKALNFGLGILAFAAEAEANEPVHTYQCSYCGQLRYGKHMPSPSQSTGCLCNYYKVHMWNKVD
jgi:tetratricopeptide (TPR) repeat protein